MVFITRRVAFVEPFFVLIQTDDISGVLGELHIAGISQGHRRFGVGGHVHCVGIHRASLSSKYLILPAANFALPLRAVFVEQMAGFFRIKQKRPRIPAVFNSERVQRAQHSRRTGPGETIDRDDPDMLCADARLDAAIKVRTCKQIVQEAWDFRQRERVIVPGNATPHVPKKAVIVLCEAELICNGNAPQPFCLKERAEDVFEDVDARAKVIKNLGSYVAGG